nr:hypothetical protein [uncultured Dongia sp.]
MKIILRAWVRESERSVFLGTLLGSARRDSCAFPYLAQVIAIIECETCAGDGFRRSAHFFILHCNVWALRQSLRTHLS